MWDLQNPSSKVTNSTFNPEIIRGYHMTVFSPNEFSDVGSSITTLVIGGSASRWYGHSAGPSAYGTTFLKWDGNAADESMASPDAQGMLTVNPIGLGGINLGSAAAGDAL